LPVIKKYYNPAGGFSSRYPVQFGQIAADAEATGHSIFICCKPPQNPGGERLFPEATGEGMYQGRKFRPFPV